MPVPFLDAAPWQCRFPVSGECLSLMVCGAPIADGESYCAACHATAYSPTPLFDPKVRWLDPTVVSQSPRSDHAHDLVEVMS